MRPHPPDGTKRELPVPSEVTLEMPDHINKGNQIKGMKHTEHLVLKQRQSGKNCLHKNKGNRVKTVCKKK